MTPTELVTHTAAKGTLKWHQYHSRLFLCLLYMCPQLQNGYLVKILLVASEKAIMRRGSPQLGIKEIYIMGVNGIPLKAARSTNGRKMDGISKRKRRTSQSERTLSGGKKVTTKRTPSDSVLLQLSVHMCVFAVVVVVPWKLIKLSDKKKIKSHGGETDFHSLCFVCRLRW